MQFVIRTLLLTALAMALLNISGNGFTLTKSDRRQLHVASKHLRQTTAILQRLLTQWEESL